MRANSNPDVKRTLVHSSCAWGVPKPVVMRTMMVVQYWRSKEALLAYATDKTRAHIPAWRWMNKAVGLNGDVGTWHETYMIKAGAHESLYVNMPEFGLGKAGKLTQARGQKRTARGRLGEKNAHAEWADLSTCQWARRAITRVGDSITPAVTGCGHARSRSRDGRRELCRRKGVRHQLHERICLCVQYVVAQARGPYQVGHKRSVGDSDNGYGRPEDLSRGIDDKRSRNHRRQNRGH